MVYDFKPLYRIHLLHVSMKWLYFLHAQLPSDYRITATYSVDNTHRSRLTKVGYTTGEDSRLILRLLNEENGPVSVDKYLEESRKRSRFYHIYNALKKLDDQFKLYIVCFVPLPDETVYEKPLESYFRSFWGRDLPPKWPLYFNKKLKKRQYSPLAPSEWILVDAYFIAKIYQNVNSCESLMTNGFVERSVFNELTHDITFELEDFVYYTIYLWES